MCGLVPFGEDYDDPFNIYHEIVQGKLTFKADLRDNKLISLNKALLSENPTQRLMGGEDFQQLKSCPFFLKFQWDLLLERKYTKTQFVPPSELLDYPKDADFIKGGYTF